MSYILDALRRADSERERERSAVPGLHTQAVGGADADTEAPANPWKWPIAATFVALLGLVAWLWLGRAEAPEPAASRAPPATAGPLATPPLAPAAAPAVALPTAVPAAVPAIAPAVAPPPAARPTPTSSTSASPASASARDPAAPAVRKPPAPLASAKASPTAAAGSAAAAAKPTAKASEPEVKISTLSELPDEVRRELPAITVGGSIYSKSAANRMLVINGQVFHEGDELAPTLVLEQIRPKSAVLKFKTYRYEITY